MGCRPGSRSRVDQRGNSGGYSSSPLGERSTENSARSRASLADRSRSVAREPEYIGHRVQARGLSRSPTRRAHRAACERLAVRGFVPEFDLLFGADEPDRVLADQVAASDHGKPDRPRHPRPGSALTREYAEIIELAALRGSDAFAERQSRA